jgi:hypothetical protein
MGETKGKRVKFWHLRGEKTETLAIYIPFSTRKEIVSPLPNWARTGGVTGLKRLDGAQGGGVGAERRPSKRVFASSGSCMLCGGTQMPIFDSLGPCLASLNPCRIWDIAEMAFM